MRTLLIVIVGLLLGCGPNRKVSPGEVKVTAVETAPAERLQLVPGQPSTDNSTRSK